MNLHEQLIRDEGRFAEAYPDPLSPLGLRCTSMRLAMPQYRAVTNWQELSAAPWTIGVGHTGKEVVQGLRWSDALVDATLDHDITLHDALLFHGAPWAADMQDLVRQAVLRNMCFNLGWGNGSNGLSAFHQTLEAVRTKQWQTAALKMVQSVWYRKTGDRPKRLVKQMETGEWV